MITSKCKYCGQAIIWVKIPSGATRPLDASPRVAYVVTGDALSGPNPTVRGVQVRDAHRCAGEERGG